MASVNDCIDGESYEMGELREVWASTVQLCVMQNETGQRTITCLWQSLVAAAQVEDGLVGRFVVQGNAPMNKNLANQIEWQLVKNTPKLGMLEDMQKQ